ncbi:MAG: cytochrome C oxidase subunit IV family protein [Acidobacteria bacterium]|nr:cytochrome C oxidase subunit IV family protein [Acidobacteriota bacterium]
MSNHAQTHAEGGTRLYLVVWAALLALTAVEIYLAYIHLTPNVMITILMGLSVIKAALIIAYFMHLRFERFSLFLTLVPIWVLVTLFLFAFFNDSFRLLQFRFP